MLGAYLELVRPANVATALGDVLAGFAVAGLGNPRALPWLLVSTACLYAGGVVLNDVFDRHVDAVERPERPLPSGRVAAGHAAALGAGLLAAGVLAAALGTDEAGRTAIAIAAAVLLYDGWSKKTQVLGPLNMGACRGLNLSLGMATVPGTIAVYWPLCLIPTAYIAGVTRLSRGEVSGGRHSSSTFSLVFVALSIAAVFFVVISMNRHVWPALAVATLFAWRVVPAFFQACRTPTPAAIRAAVKRGVLSLVLLDAALATAFVGIGYGLVLLAAALGALWLGRIFFGDLTVANERQRVSRANGGGGMGASRVRGYAGQSPGFHMDVVDQQFLVTFRYPVHFTRGVFAATNPLLRKVLTDKSQRHPTDLVVVVDDGVVRAHPKLLADIAVYAQKADGELHMTAPVLVVPGGEEVKNDPRHLEAIYERLHDAALCRQSYVVVVGGGAVLDAVGYATATAHRGLRLVRVPTTVLAQDDSAMGVKNGVNAFGKKNYLGAFAPPFAVINDFEFLPTLLDRDWLSGVSEAIKAALIKDPDFFAHIEHQARKLVSRDQAAMEDVIRHSAALHLSHIATAGDPFEQSSSRPLDFGHWAAHKLEQLSRHRLRHGEAVAIGIALDSTYSYLSGSLAEKDWRRIVDVLLALNLAVSAPELEEALDDPGNPRSVLGGLAEFREHLGGQLTIMLLRSIGDAFDVHEIDTGVMIRSIETLRHEHLEAVSAHAYRAR